jgi:hypothetical protein
MECRRAADMSLNQDELDEIGRVRAASSSARLERGA